MNEIIIAFAGMRVMTSGKKGFEYITQSGKEEKLYFKKALVKHSRIGDMHKVTYDGKQVKVIEDKAGCVQKDVITEWSAREKIHLLEYQQAIISKKKPEGHIDYLIEKIRETTTSSSRRKIIALYIFEKLTR